MQTWFARDGLGTVRALFNSSAAQVRLTNFDPYGSPLDGTGTVSTHLGYTGALTDETGLVYLHARFYAPGSGQFLSGDPIEGRAVDPRSWNRYGYVSGNPINAVDPSGKCLLSANDRGPASAQGDSFICPLAGNGWIGPGFTPPGMVPVAGVAIGVAAGSVVAISVSVINTPTTATLSDAKPEATPTGVDNLPLTSPGKTSVIVPKQRGDESTWEYIAEKLGIKGADGLTPGKILRKEVEKLKQDAGMKGSDSVGIDVKTGDVIPIPKNKKDAKEIEELGGLEPIGNVKPPAAPITPSEQTAF